MTSDNENVTDTRAVRSSTLRVRRHRERRRGLLRLLTVEIHESVIEDAITRGLLKPEESAPWVIIESAYAAQLSDKALKWLIDNAVIIAEQRSNAVEILRCMSVWLEGAAA
jgi:hypothetical protein